MNDAVEREGVIKGVIECVRYRPGVPGGVRYLRVFFVRRVSQRGFRYGGGRRFSIIWFVSAFGGIWPGR